MAEVLAANTAGCLRAAANQTPKTRLDAETLDRWKKYLNRSDLIPPGVRSRIPETASRASKLTDDNKRRTVYGFVSRRRLDGTLALFDFPNPNATREQSLDTNVPLQRLFFLTSAFILQQSRLLADRVQPLATDSARIERAYTLLFGRAPTQAERKAGLDFLVNGRWPEYAHALLSSNEFSFVD